MGRNCGSAMIAAQTRHRLGIHASSHAPTTIIISFSIHTFVPCSPLPPLPSSSLQLVVRQLLLRASGRVQPPRRRPLRVVHLRPLRLRHRHAVVAAERPVRWHLHLRSVKMMDTRGVAVIRHGRIAPATYAAVPTPVPLSLIHIHTPSPFDRHSTRCCRPQLTQFAGADANSSAPCGWWSTNGYYIRHPALAMPYWVSAPAVLYDGYQTVYLIYAVVLPSGDRTVGGWRSALVSIQVDQTGPYGTPTDYYIMTGVHFNAAPIVVRNAWGPGIHAVAVGGSDGRVYMFPGVSRGDGRWKMPVSMQVSSRCQRPPLVGMLAKPHTAIRPIASECPSSLIRHVRL